MSFSLPVLPAVADLAEAAATAGSYDAVISLVDDKYDVSVLYDHPNRLYCPFEDVAFEGEPGSFSLQHAAIIMAFVDTVDGSLLVHCMAGQSRSTAIALASAVRRGMPPMVAAAALLEAHPPHRPFTPNPWVLLVCDELLQCRGTLLEAGLAYVRF